MMKTFSHKSGFTLIETMIAIGILVLAILGSFTAVRTGISTSNYAKNQVVAFYLAQEAVEQIRNLRDLNALDVITSPPPGWLDGIANPIKGDPCSPGNICKVDVLGGGTVLSVCSGGICPDMRQSPAGAFGYDPTWSATSFNRKVTIATVNGHEVTITVTVTWKRGTLTQTFVVSENLLDWE